MAEKRQLARNTMYNAVAQVAQMASAFVFMPFLIRLFGASNYGVFLLAGSVTGYLGLLDLGVGTSLTKRVAEYRARGAERELEAVVSSALVFYAVVGLIGAAAMVLLAFFAVPHFNLTPDQQQLATRMLLIAAAGPPLLWPLGVGSQVLSGLQRYDITARVSLGTVAASASVTLYVLISHEGPLFLLLAGLGVGVIASLVNLVLAKRILSTASFHPGSASRSGVVSLFSISWAVFIVQICTLIVYQQTDRLVLGVFIGATAITLYEAAAKLQGLVIQVAALPVSAILPTASQLDAQGRTDAVRSLWVRGTKYTALFVLPIVVALMVVSRTLLLRWLGPAFATQALAAQVILSYWLVNANLPVGHAMLYGLARFKALLVIVVTQTVLNLVISLVLVQRLGVMGVVLGTTLPFFLAFPAHLWLQLRVFRLSLTDWLRDVAVRVYPPLVLPIALAFVLINGVLGQSLAGVALTLMISVGAYWVAALFVSLTPAEKTELTGFARSLRDRLQAR
jgi:O-antigen/teichoic acid export membrane protein